MCGEWLFFALAPGKRLVSSYSEIEVELEYTLFGCVQHEGSEVKGRWFCLEKRQSKQSRV